MRLPFRAGTLLAAPLLVLLIAPFAAPARAAPELITNGNFESWTVAGAASTESYIVTGGQTSGSGGATLTGWTNSGYTFLFRPGTASAAGAVVSGNTRLALWGPDGGASSGNYSNNGMTAASPVGGSFLAEDGAYQRGTVGQTVSNLVVGQTYNLSFWWAAAQQASFTGDNTNGWSVAWSDANGNTVSSYNTATVATASRGFSAWRKDATQFVATTTTMTLAFMATAAPGGSPPFSLLDGVSLQAASPVPEPGSWAMALAGCVALAAVRRGRRPALARVARRADGSSGGI